MSPTPGLVLRRSILLWGLGDVALGERGLGVAWMLAEALALAAVILSSLLLADSTWYLVPFLLGAAFIAAWAFQAVTAFHRAQHRAGAIAPTPRGSAAAAVAWLTLPILVWGTGFWLIGASGASPAAVLDRFVTEWPADGAIGDADVHDAAAAALDQLRSACARGELKPDCGQSPVNLLRDVRLRIVFETGDAATAVAESVDYEQRATSVLWFFHGTELVPVARDALLRLELRAEPVTILGLDLGARRWRIATASRPAA